MLVSSEDGLPDLAHLPAWPIWCLMPKTPTETVKTDQCNQLGGEPKSSTTLKWFKMEYQYTEDLNSKQSKNLRKVTLFT